MYIEASHCKYARAIFFHFVAAAMVTTGMTNLEDAEVRVGSCEHTVGASDAEDINIMKENAVCGLPVDADEITLDHRGFWLFRECSLNYYGQYVYITKEVDTGVASFNLCEVEVWGIDSKHQ